MNQRLLPLVFLVSMGCVPQNAELTSGSFRAFLSESTSFTLVKESIDMDTDQEDGLWDDNYSIDCRDLSLTEDANGDGSNEDEQELRRLENRLNVCDRRKNAYPLEYETWIDNGAFYVRGNELTPWRGEAIMTSEGDFHLTFHNRLPGGSDMRFAVAVDPNFQPTQCVQNDDGGSTQRVNIDGNWLDGWSGDLTEMAEDENLSPALAKYASHFAGGTLFYPNARSYQFDPGNTDSFWSIPNEWRAGHAEGKFSEEFFHARTVRYGEPSVYATFDEDEEATIERDDMFFCKNRTDGKGCKQLCNYVNGLADDIAGEINWIGPDGGSEDVESEDWYRPLVHCNTWRDPDLEGPLEAGEPDHTAAGLDGWVGLHYNWLIIDEGSDLTEGGSASGAFSFVFDGDDSQSRFFIEGEFDVEKIKGDRWTTDDIEAIKFEQNGTVLCE
jgi:hypothetical protein